MLSPPTGQGQQNMYDLSLRQLSVTEDQWKSLPIYCACSIPLHERRGEGPKPHGFYAAAQDTATDAACIPIQASDEARQSLMRSFDPRALSSESGRCNCTWTINCARFLLYSIPLCYSSPLCLAIRCVSVFPAPESVPAIGRTLDSSGRQIPGSRTHHHLSDLQGVIYQHQRPLRLPE
jgi:hypothetical protein